MKKSILLLAFIGISFSAISQSGLKITSTMQTDKGASSDVNVYINAQYSALPATLQAQVIMYLHTTAIDSNRVICKAFYPVEIKSMYAFNDSTIVGFYNEKGAVTIDAYYDKIKAELELKGLTIVKIP